MAKFLPSFTEFVLLRENSMRPANKSSLYPLGYGGIGLYPPAAYIAAAADAVLYITQDERLFNNGVGSPWPIKHIPGPPPPKNPNSGTGGIFSIKHIPGPDPNPDHNNAGEGSPFSIKHLPS